MIGKKIKELRKAKDESQSQLAAVLNITPGAVCGWENGHWSLTVDNLIALCNHFDTTPNDLLGWDNTDNQAPAA